MLDWILRPNYYDNFKETRNSTNCRDIDFKDFMNLCQKSTAKPFSFLAIYATPASKNPLHFRKNLLEGI